MRRLTLTAYLDTHVAAFLHAGDPNLLSPAALHVLDASQSLRVSPMVQLELEYLCECAKIAFRGEEIIGFLQDHFGVVPDCENLAAAVFHAGRESWTRDPFDRIITAQAAVCGAVLLTRDERIRANYRQAVW